MDKLLPIPYTTGGLLVGNATLPGHILGHIYNGYQSGLFSPSSASQLGIEDSLTLKNVWELLEEQYIKPIIPRAHIVVEQYSQESSGNKTPAGRQRDWNRAFGYLLGDTIIQCVYHPDLSTPWILTGLIDTKVRWKESRAIEYHEYMKEVWENEI